MLERMKKLKEAELKNKEEKLKKEIEDLESKREKDMLEMEDELVKEERTLDEEMMKAMNELLFRERRAYSINHARLQRKIDFTSADNDQMNEVFLYNIAESMFSNPNLKLKESLSFVNYERNKGSERMYQGNASPENYTLEGSSYDAGKERWDEVYQQNNSSVQNSYSSNDSSLEKIDKDLENRRRSY